MKTDTVQGCPVEIIESAEDLRRCYDPPSDLVLKKCLQKLDVHCRAFIARSPFVCVATADAEGRTDVSPRGDAPGFVRVLDESTLLIPDRPGNNRIDSLLNLMQNPQVGLLFLIPGVDETLRVNGSAKVIRSEALLAPSAAQGKVPKSAILISVQEAYLQCAKALKRSKLWTDDYRIDRAELPTLGKMLVDQTQCNISQEDLEALIEKAYREKLY